jgi:hypothetical protein
LSQSSVRRLGHEWAAESCLQRRRLTPRCSAGESSPQRGRGQACEAADRRAPVRAPLALPGRATARAGAERVSETLGHDHDRRQRASSSVGRRAALVERGLPVGGRSLRTAAELTAHRLRAPLAGGPRSSFAVSAC